MILSEYSITFCAVGGGHSNPGKTRWCVDDYIRAECSIELDYLYAIAEEAKRFGFHDDVEIASNNPRCATCFSSACQFIIKPRGTSNQNEEEQDTFPFIDYDMGYDDPLAFVLEKL
jgi:hypothetical protein